MDSPLLRVKALIWIQSLLGALLLIAFFATLENHVKLSYLVLGIGAGWCAVLWPIGRWASELTEAERVPPTGLPGWLLALLAIGQIGSLAVPDPPALGWLIVGHFFVGAAMLFRGFLSAAMDVPIHGRTWTACMLLTGLGLVRYVVTAFARAVAGC